MMAVRVYRHVIGRWRRRAGAIVCMRQSSGPAYVYGTCLRRRAGRRGVAGAMRAFLGMRSIWRGLAGLGSGLEMVVEPGTTRELAPVYRRWSYLRALQDQGTLALVPTPPWTEWRSEEPRKAVVIMDEPVIPHLTIVHIYSPAPLTANPPTIRIVPSLTFLRAAVIDSRAPALSRRPLRHRTHMQPHQIQIPKALAAREPTPWRSAGMRSGPGSRLRHQDARSMPAWLRWRGYGRVDVGGLCGRWVWGAARAGAG
jgi:hypothetical protein